VAIAAFPHFIGVRLNETEFAILQRLVAQKNSTIAGTIRELIVGEAVRLLLPRTAEGEAHDGHGR
jgi:hypothetical protein